jgi:D-sedoheptulose 7-phosphate isomerase
MLAADHDFVADYLMQSTEALRRYVADADQLALLDEMADAVAQAIRNGGKLLIAGNGGSAGDAQHIAAEFTGRMLYDRAPLAAIALHTDTSALTAVGNDYGFAHVFERQVQALARPGDVVLGLSTSGRSDNVLRALAAGRAMGLMTIGFTGAGGGAMAAHADLLLRAPSDLTPIVQQIHMVAGHLLCALVERAIHPRTS